MNAASAPLQRSSAAAELPMPSSALGRSPALLLVQELRSPVDWPTASRSYVLASVSARGVKLRGVVGFFSWGFGLPPRAYSTAASASQVGIRLIFIM
ncbi:hypothetical protein EUGRSUZ_B01446 [Eucalyptus grandis]|uniref:Uncharacterized protein n=2 Tax=Eucalyptus grandis TaxID=71139 RepID=A0ACC3LR00_EUCGR|nr:hypothetical protein EUGRSUZ_B01446 [Eucalyptus grandis]